MEKKNQRYLSTRLVPTNITTVLQSHVKKLSKTQLWVKIFYSNKNPPGDIDVVDLAILLTKGHKS